MLGIAMPSDDEQLEWNLLALGLTEEMAVPRAQNWRGSLGIRDKSVSLTQNKKDRSIRERIEGVFKSRVNMACTKLQSKSA
ncbi:MAG: hypothetical protein GY796_17875 [Chloroflexi bacterium]|nr:hypothetical protein [Chloroflexota bacterium]